jgi:hypothetical protein
MNYHGMVAKARWLEGRQGDNASIEFNIQQGSLQTNQQSNQRKQLSKKQQRLATAARCGHRSTSCWLVGSPDICRNKSRNPSESSYVLAVYGSKIEIDVNCRQNRTVRMHNRQAFVPLHGNRNFLGLSGLRGLNLSI